MKLRKWNLNRNLFNLLNIIISIYTFICLLNLIGRDDLCLVASCRYFQFIASKYVRIQISKINL